jgi:hypothetical protein
VPLSQQVNAVSRTRFSKWGAIRKHTTKKTPAGSHTLHDQRTQLTGKSQNSFLLWRLQIEMRRQVEKPTPALIETTAHAKRWCFGLSRKKSGIMPLTHADRQPDNGERRDRPKKKRFFVWGLIRGNFYFSAGPISINVSWFPLVRGRVRRRLARTDQ